MLIYLCAVDNELLKAWEFFCKEFDFVVPTKQAIMHVKADALVSPSNSFGEMTGGIDLHYKQYLGEYIQESLQKKIKVMFDGELPIGMATSIPLEKSIFSFNYLIAAPTMRVPENVRHTINAFLAMKAILIEANKLGVESIVLPGLGTGTGCMAYEACAKQVMAAIRYVLIEKRCYGPIVNIYEEQKWVFDNVVSTEWLNIQYSRI